MGPGERELGTWRSDAQPAARAPRRRDATESARCSRTGDSLDRDAPVDDEDDSPVHTIQTVRRSVYCGVTETVTLVCVMRMGLG